MRSLAPILSFFLAVIHNSVAPNWPLWKKSKEAPSGPLQLEVNEYRIFHEPPIRPEHFAFELGQTTFVVLDPDKKKVIGVVHNTPFIARFAIPKNDDYVSVEIGIKDNVAKITMAKAVSDAVRPEAQFKGKIWGKFVYEAIIVSTTNGNGNGAGTSSQPLRLATTRVKPSAVSK